MQESSYMTTSLNTEEMLMITFEEQGQSVRNNLASNIESKLDFAIRQVYVRVLVV
jgi:hypothetical protein